MFIGIFHSAVWFEELHNFFVVRRGLLTVTRPRPRRRSVVFFSISRGFAFVSL